MPRAGLSRAVVVAAAADLADEVGYDRLTLAVLASRLGVAVPSLYKHVDGLDALRRGIAIVALGELGDRLRSALAVDAGPSPRAQLAALADAYRAYARAHPGRYAAAQRAPRSGDTEHEAAGASVVATVFGVLAERGLEGDDAIDAARALRAALHGFVALEVAGGFGLPRSVDRSFARLVEWLERGFDDEGAPRAGGEPARPA